MSLKQILEQYQEAKATANVNPNDVAPNVRSGVEGLVRQAERQKSELEQQYKDKVIESVMVIAVSGPGSDKFGQIAKDKLKVLALSYDFVTDLLTQKIKDRGGKDPLGSQEYMFLLDELNKLRVEYNIAYIPPIQNHNLFQKIAHLDLKGSIAFIFDTNFGNSLNTAVLRREIANQAFTGLFSEGKLPVVVYNYKKLDGALLPEPIGVIETEEEVDEQFVKEALSKIKNKLKGTKKTKGEENE